MEGEKDIFDKAFISPKIPRGCKCFFGVSGMH